MLFADDRLLFFDSRNIDSMEDCSLVLNPPAKRGPCVQIEKDWELGLRRASSVVCWNGLYRLYYSVAVGEWRQALAYVESADGVVWHRPELGAVPFNGSTGNNLIDIGDSDPHENCLFVDPSAPEEHRFKLICHHPWKGLWLMTSPDGAHFTRADGMLLEKSTDNHMTVFYDQRIGKYRLYLRGSTKDRQIMGWAGSRMVIYAETDDLFRPLEIDTNAPDPHTAAKERPGPDGKMVQPLAGINKELPSVMSFDEKDPPEADLYQPAAIHYAPESYLAFPTLYYHYPGPPEGFINDGLLDIQFAASRDGYLWRRDHRGSYVRLDFPGEPAAKQMHMLVGASVGRHTLNQYYVGHPYSHGEDRTAGNPKPERHSHFGDPIALRLEQRIDGFVSADSSYTGGSLLTRPFVVKAPELAVNIDTSASGAAFAALVGEDGREIAGFGLADSDRIQGNFPHKVLSWRGSSEVSAVVGRPLRLLVKSRNTKLFAVYPGGTVDV